MRIKIHSQAYSYYVSSANPQPVNWKWAEMLKALEGRWIEVETEYCFATQFNTVPVPGWSDNGLRIEARYIEDIDFGDLGYQGWRRKIIEWHKKAWPGSRIPGTDWALKYVRKEVKNV